VVDPRLGGAYDVTQFNRVAFAASLCIRASATCRPTMSEVPQTHLFLNFRITFTFFKSYVYEAKQILMGIYQKMCLYSGFYNFL